MRLAGRTGIVTGAARGIGAVTARALAVEGVNLTLFDRDGDGVTDVAREIAELGVRAIPVHGDVTNADDRARLVSVAEQELGPVDVLVNNAAIIEWVPFVQQSADRITEMVETNLTAPLLLARAVLPQMVQRRTGHLVTLCSLEGKVGIPHTATYGATKAALLVWNAALRAELDGSGVGVTAIAPGYVTGAGMWAAWNLPAPPLSGPVTPEKVANAVVRALRDNPQEIIVRSTPTRPLLAVAAIRPEIAGWLLKVMGIDKQMKSLISK
jgi:short-subunit dehydrogenase